MVNRRAVCQLGMAAVGGLAAGRGTAAEPAAPAPSSRLEPAAEAPPSVQTLDMVYANPGEAPPSTRYLDPAFLAERGYDAVVIEQSIEGVPLLSAYDPTLVPPGTVAHRFAMALRADIQARIGAAKAQGLKVYAWVQFVVLPEALLARHGPKLVDAQGRLDVRLPETQKVLRLFTAELFDSFPQLDGLVVRTGEVYLHGLPHHNASPRRAPAGTTSPGTKPDDAESRLIQAATAITQGEQSHRALIALLREVVCVQHGRRLIYRTWDFGNNFHTNPRYYLDVTEAIAPHPLLAFSIKHQQGDFHRLLPFNPTLGIGSHRQVVEVQAQLEAYGKGAHPYYVAQGVIEGWEEYAWLMPHTALRGLAPLVGNPRLAGVWTWSRGGGWGGPRIPNELWCDLNAYVVSGFAREPGRGEAGHFLRYAREVLKLSPADSERFRRACLLSASAVLRGQMTALGASIWEWWARDDTFSEPDLRDFINKGLVAEAIAEKQAACAQWEAIVALIQPIRFADADTGTFARVSAQYGLCKFRVVAAAWTALLLTGQGRQLDASERPAVRQALSAYDQAWADWRELARREPQCASLPQPVARGGGDGLAAAMERCRQLVTTLGSGAG